MSLSATIRIRPETRAALNDLKRGVETQDDVIRRLMGFARERYPEVLKPLLDIEEEVKPDEA